MRLKRRGKLAGFEFAQIDGSTQQEKAEVFAEALIFLAVSEREGFGLPSAEAMASECIVIGYTGHGGDEFFSEHTGYPVREGDLIGFVHTIENVVKEYDLAPEKIDQQRKRAGRLVKNQYSEARMEETLLETLENWYPNGTISINQPNTG